MTRERITCAALGERLEPGNNRYLPYVAEVQADPRAAYVFPAGSPQAKAFAAKSSAFGAPLIQIGLDGYVVYMSTGDGLSAMSQRVTTIPAIREPCFCLDMRAATSHGD